VAKLPQVCTKDTLALFAISLSVASLVISALSGVASSAKNAVPPSRSPWILSRNDAITRIATRIFHQVRENPITAVERTEGLTYGQIESIFIHEAKSRILPESLATLKRLGIDEIALRKGKGDFALILTHLDTAEVADVLEGRTQEKSCLKKSVPRLKKSPSTCGTPMMPFVLNYCPTRSLP
jgi:hypothetical protein